eukprot:1176188-Pleurochrysis_carterae.AAC.1
MARVLPNKQSVDECCHNWFTDSSESENEGTQRTSRSVRSTEAPFASRARSGRSPMTVQGCVRPSTPVTRSEHGLAFTRSSRRGCICHVHPLSTTKVLLARSCASLRARDAEVRRWRDANSALALVAGGGDVVGGGAASTFAPNGDRVAEGCSSEVECVAKRVA